MRSLFLSTLAVLPVLGSVVPSRIGTVKIPLEKRFKLVDEDGVVNKDLLRGELIRSTNKIQRGFEAFEQNTGSAHPFDNKLHTRAVGNDPLTDFEEVLWSGSISVGTPASTFTVDFDTGSSDLFLPGSNCNTNCNGHKRYTTSASSTAVDQRRTFSLAFGDGSTVQGEVFHDTVTVAGITATGQAVGAATTYSTGFALANFPPDGLLGMAFPQISVFRENPFFQTAVAQGKTTSSVFAFRLATSGSELTVGGTDTSKFTGALTSVPVTTQGFWQINIGGLSVSGRTPVGQVGGIVDTGTTLILGDQRNVAAFYAAIPGARDATATVGAGFFTSSS
ncbi:hypothetical protein V5O48_000004 [Marasmius crinis-equi]|uniref:Peptidase A1 domain-containing protein n=1 Tax=Marasmius crinis-equi TaxID=585013 RepID=A0ABR3G268_9AGAR